MHKQKVKATNRNLKNQSPQPKKTLKKIRKGETNQITTAFKREAIKRRIESVIMNSINIQIPSQRAQNPYKFKITYKLLLNQGLKEFLKNFKHKKETKISETTSKTI